WASSESNHTAHAPLDCELENCIFYILRMYEFSHSQGHFEPQQPRLATPFAPEQLQKLTHFHSFGFRPKRSAHHVPVSAHRFQSSAPPRRTAGACGFLLLIQCRERPDW